MTPGLGVIDSMSKLKSLGSVALTLCLLGCGSAGAPTTGDGPVDATGSWQLTGGTVDGAPFPQVADAPVTMTVAGTEISGQSPCNHYGGRVVVDGTGTRFELGEMTARGCEQPVMAAEAVFVAALPRVRAVAHDGARLILTGPGVELIFEKAGG